jgi:hypothetical protein
MRKCVLAVSCRVAVGARAGGELGAGGPSQRVERPDARAARVPAGGAQGLERDVGPAAAEAGVKRVVGSYATSCRGPREQALSEQSRRWGPRVAIDSKVARQRAVAGLVAASALMFEGLKDPGTRMATRWLGPPGGRPSRVVVGADGTGRPLQREASVDHGGMLERELGAVLGWP